MGRSSRIKDNKKLLNKLKKNHPHHQFRLSNQGNIQRKFKSRWSMVCRHNRIPRICVECDGADICVHKKRKYRCLKCDGSQMCSSHKKRKYICKECDGNGLCKQHGKQKFHCRKCRKI